MAEFGGQGGGGLDDVVLDEDFVRGATVSELDAEHRAKARAKERAKADKRERRLYRRHVRRRRLRRAVQTVVIVAGIVGVGVAAGASGRGPLSFLQGDDAAVDELAAVETAEEPPVGAAAAASTPTTVVLERRQLDVGECVLWDQTANRFGSPNHVEVVRCDQPHLMEVTGSFDLPSGPYPSESEWAAMFDTGRCAEMGGAYVGGSLDPAGLYGPRGLIPLRDSWSVGDREVWCGLRRYPMEQAASEEPSAELFTGAIDRTPGAQYRIYPIGSCLGPDGDGLTFGTVSCDGPHDVEIAGHVDLSGRVDQFPAPDQYDRLVADDCRRQAKAYAGRNLRDPVFSGWLGIGQGSWDAGRRTVLCTVAEYRNEDSLTITRRLGAPPA